MIDITTINYAPLKKCSRAFKATIWLKRIRMIAVRIIFFVLAGLYLWAMLSYVDQINRAIDQRKGMPYSEKSSTYTIKVHTFTPSPLLLLLPIGYLFVVMLAYWMVYASMKDFARKNGMSLLNSNTMSEQASIEKIQYVPSFRGRMFAWAMPPVVGQIDNDTSFALFSRIYKEGGALRWRERKMDTILLLEFPINLPSVAINARANERARRSNLSTHYDASWKFRFEGAWGSKYDVYASPEQRTQVLQLFSPEVLEKIYHHLPQADIEMKEGRMWLVQRYGILDDTTAKKLFDAAAAILPDIHQYIARQRIIDKPLDIA